MLRKWFSYETAKTNTGQHIKYFLFYVSFETGKLIFSVKYSLAMEDGFLLRIRT